MTETMLTKREIEMNKAHEKAEQDNTEQGAPENAAATEGAPETKGDEATEGNEPATATSVEEAGTASGSSDNGNEPTAA